MKIFKIKYLFLFMFYLTLLFAEVLSKPVLAAENIRLHLNFLPHRLTEKSGTQYDLFLKEVFAGSGLRIISHTVPIGRSRKLFLKDAQSCLFPSNIRALEPEDAKFDVITSTPIDVVSLRLYTIKKTQAGANLRDFSPNRVGYILGSGAIHILGDNADRYVPISSEEGLIKMLELGRLDAFLGHHPDTALALEDMNKPSALHVSPVMIANMRFPITFICHNNETGKALLDYVNPKIEEMRVSGRLREILGPHAEIATPGDNSKKAVR